MPQIPLCIVYCQGEDTDSNDFSQLSEWLQDRKQSQMKSSQKQKSSSQKFPFRDT